MVQHVVYPPTKGGELEGGLDGEEEGEEDVHVHQHIRQHQVRVVVLYKDVRQLKGPSHEID
jgi:hypothetical protein